MPEDPTPYIKESENKITRPAICAVTSEKLNLDDGDVVLLTDEFRPLMDEHSERAGYVASVARAGGYPWNGIHPETGETQALESTGWWKLQDVKSVSLFS